MRLDMNDEVRVKLTDYGRKMLKEYDEDLWSTVGHPNPPEYEPPREDEHGYSTWQMWKLMSELGPYLSMGFQNLFEPTVRLKVNADLRERIESERDRIEEEGSPEIARSVVVGILTRLLEE